LNLVGEGKMEGPSVKVIADKLQGFKGRRIQAVSGNARIDRADLQGRPIEDIFTHGKNLFLRLPRYSIRIHFLMYGSYRVNQQRDGIPARLSLGLDYGGQLNFYNCAIRLIDNGELERIIDEELDIMSRHWNQEKVLSRLQARNDELICDILLDQDLFAGVGNIIKNEALFRAGLHPSSLVGKTPTVLLNELTDQVRQFSLLFYQLRREQKRLKPYLHIYRKRTCTRCQGKVALKRTGSRQRISYLCPDCQRLYA